MALGSIFSMLSESGILNNTQQSQSTGGEVENLLGSLLGGSQATTTTGGQAITPASQNASEDVLGMILNVVQSPQTSSFVQPIVNKVATKLGIPPATALTVVTFVIHYLATNHGTKIANGEDINGVLTQHSDANFIQTNNIANQLAQKTGLDSQTSAQAMSEVFKLLGVSK